MRFAIFWNDQETQTVVPFAAATYQDGEIYAQKYIEQLKSENPTKHTYTA